MDPLTGEHRADADLAIFLAEHYRPSGHRLGIMLADLGPGSPERTAAVEGPGPRDRRVQHVTGATLCRLQPRPEERIVRPDDVTDFVKRYGHEYAVVVVSADCPTIASVAEAEGCAVVVTQGPR